MAVSVTWWGTGGFVPECPLLLYDHSFGQSLPEGLNYTEHSYLQMIKHLIRTNFSRMWDVLEGSWFVYRSQDRKKSLKN